MDQSKDKSAVVKLLREAILQLCRVSMTVHGNFMIDGIICISKENSDDQEFVVKIHEKIVEIVPNENCQMQVSIGEIAPATNNIIHSNINLQNNTNMIAANKCNPVMQNSNIEFSSKDIIPVVENDVEILDIATEKQLFGDIDNFSDIECTGYEFDDLSFNDVVVKPDPGNFGKLEEESSDEELKIETLKAGRVRKPHKGSYRDVHGASVQVLSKEEFKRILKSDKLKRSRDKSPDFVSAQKVLKTGSDNSLLQMKPHHFGTTRSLSLQSHTEIPKIIGKISHSLSDAQSQCSRPSVSILKHNQSLPQGTGVCHVQLGNNDTVRQFSVGKQMQSQGKFIQNDQINRNVNHAIVHQNVAVPQKQVILSTTKPRSDLVTCVNSLNMAIPSLNSTLNTCPSDFTQQRHAILPAPTYVNVKQSEPQKSNSALFQLSHSLQNNSAVSVSSIIPNKLNPLPEIEEENEISNPVNVICLEVCNEATKSKSHECPVCAEVFDCFKNLDLHMYRVHPGMFVCPICGKSFKQRSTRNRHIVALHSAEKNFNCHLCNISFTRSDTLKKHFNMHHPGIEIPKKPFSYSKGLTAEQQTLTLSSDQGSTSSASYESGVISPIQVTAAVEVSDSSVTDVTSLSTHNVANITPVGSSESVIAAEHRNENTPVTCSNSTLRTDDQHHVVSNSDAVCNVNKLVMQSMIAPSHVQMTDQHVLGTVCTTGNGSLVKYNKNQKSVSPQEEITNIVTQSTSFSGCENTSENVILCNTLEISRNPKIVNEEIVNTDLHPTATSETNAEVSISNVEQCESELITTVVCNSSRGVPNTVEAASPSTDPGNTLRPHSNPIEISDEDSSDLQNVNVQGQCTVNTE